MMKRLGILLVLAICLSPAVYAQRADLSGVKICIDPGHGGNNPANDRYLIPDPGTEFWESESNLQKALLLKTLLEAKGATVLLTRNTNSYPNDADEPSLSARVAFANANNANWFHSIHSNATGWQVNNTVNYTLMLVREKRPGGPSSGSGNGLGEPETKEAWDISLIIGPNIRSRLRTQRSTQYLDWTFYGGTNGGFSLGVLRGLLMPGQLSEGSFHDHFPETRRLMNNSYRKMEAYALRDAFLQYFEVPGDTLCVVAGILSERGTGRLVNSTRVRVMPENVVYDGDRYNNGFYMLDGLSAGQHTIRFETPGYRIDSVQVQVTAGSTTFLDRECESNLAPTVLSSTPANNDTAFVASGEVRIAFTKVMDTASVRSAFSISPLVKGALVWSNGNTTLTFRRDSVVFPFNTTFTIRIEATARSESGLFLDGNGDGNPGDPYILTFKTRPTDAWAPRLISALPSSGAVLRSPDHIINLTFDEPLNPATVTISNVAIQEIGGSVLPRTLEYSEANGKGAITVYPQGGLSAGKSYRIRVSGVADLSGNAIPSSSVLLWDFSVASTAYQYTLLDDFNSTSLSWATPAYSGSTTGLDSATFERDSAVTLRILPSNTGSARLTYYWNTSASDWLIREYLSGGTPRSITWQKQGSLLQVYLFGDGTGTLVRFAIDDSVDAFPGGSINNHEVSQWKKIDWVGWRLVEWDLENDTVGSWIGNSKLEGLLRFDSFQLKYQSGSSAASGRIYFDHLQVARATTTAVEQVAGLNPIDYELQQNYPNPFNPSTKIEYAIRDEGFVSLTVTDLLGRHVRTLVAASQRPGRHTATWNGTNDDGLAVSSGVYLYQLKSGPAVLTRKMLLLK